MKFDLGSKLFIALASSLNLICVNSAYADGGSGSVYLNSVHAEGGNIYRFGDFTNPDRCAVNSVVVLRPANEREMDRMMSMALTAIASGKKISMWLAGCGSVPWYPSAPQAVAMTFSK
jgi:hypothetical protein